MRLRISVGDRVIPIHSGGLASQPYTILDLRDSPWVDGPGRTILDCAETIDASRFRIVVGAFDGGQPNGTAYEHEARMRGLEVARISERRSLDPEVLRQIVTLGRDCGADLLHTHDFRSDLFGFAASRILGIPFVSTVHGWIANDFRGRISTWLDKQVLRKSAHVIAVSEESRRRLGGWANSNRCTVIPNALRVEQYRPDRSGRRFRESNGVSSNHVLIANIGRLSPEKSQLDFLVAARELSRRHDCLRFVLFGNGPDRAHLEQYVSESELEEVVVFAGYREDMIALYNEIDLVVQTSLTEGMPNVILESLLMEVPVVATNVGGTAEIVTDLETGLLIPPGNPAALVAAIERFVSDRDGFTAMARKGREHIIANFDHGRRVIRLGELYEHVIAMRMGYA